MNYVDVCTGIDAATVAWSDLGWKCKAVAEIEPFPCAVLATRFGASRPEFMPQPEDGDSAEDAAGKRAAIKAVSKLAVDGLVPNRGDFTTIQGDEYGTVDLLVGGTPCQDFSVAGLRAGMDGKRGQLTVEFARLAHRLVAKARARWCVWENVPGVLSIDGGEAFATFLGILAKRSVRVPEGGWANSGIIVGGDDSFGLAYRVLDAQHFGVPQRRRRVFVVGYFGDWRRAAAVLFERHSLSGDTAPRREKGQGFTHSVAPSLTGSGRGTERTGESRGQDPVVPVFGDMRLRESRRRAGLGEQRMSGSQLDAETESELSDSRVAICMATGQGSAEIGIGIGTTLNCNHEAPIVMHVTPPLTSNPYGDHESREELLVTHSLRGEGFDASENGAGRGTPLVPVYCDEVAPTLRSGSSSPASHGKQNGTDRKTLIAFSSKDHGADAGDISPTLRSMGHDASHANGGGQVAVAYRTAGDGCVYEEGELTAPLTTSTDPNTTVITLGHTKSNGLGIAETETETETANTLEAVAGANQAVGRGSMAVRRLLPEECESLQGFPRGFTKIDEKTADGPRYKALGNSMAVPVMAYLGQRIQMVEDLCK